MRPWLKKLLIVIALLLLLPTALGLFWLGGTENGLHWVYQRALAYVPGHLSIDKLEGRLFGRITATGIDYQLDENRILIAQTSLEWQPTALLIAQISVDHFHVQSLNITLPAAEKTDQPTTLPDINLPWRLVLENIQIDDLSIHQGESQFELKQIKLSASTVFNQIDIDSLSVVADSYDLSITGTLKPSRNYQHKLDIKWHTQLPSKVALEGKGRISGDIKTLSIQQKITGPLQLSLKAELKDLLQQLSWQANIDVSEMNLARLDTGLPEISGKLQLQAQGELNTATVTGKLDAVYPEQGPFDASFKLQLDQNQTVQIEQLSLHTPVTDTQLNARGQWTPGNDGGELALNLDWRNLRWPLVNTPWFDSATGNGRIDGNINNYRLSLTTDRPWPQAPPSSWYASAEGNLDGMKFHTLKILALDGEATASGQLNWSPQLSWKASVTGKNINPGKQWPAWPGQLKANLTSTGRMENDQLIIDTDITRLTGTLRGYPVTLNGQLGWHNEELVLNPLHFQSGTSKVNASGHIGATLKLDWDIATHNLAELYPQALGALQARGQLSGTKEEPLIQATFDGNKLSLPGYSIGKLSGKLGVDLFRWQQIDIKLTAETAAINDYALQSLNIDANTRQIQLKAVSEQATALIKLSGEANPKGWQGHIEKADIQSQKFANWQLRNPVALTISTDRLQLEKLCWQSQESSLCATLQHTQQSWRSQLEMHKLPLLLFSPWLPSDLVLEGVANATAEMQFNAPDELLGQINIELPAGAVTYPLLEGERDRWDYRGGNVRITLDDQGLQASSRLAMTNGDQFQAQLSLPGARLMNLDRHSQTIKGNAKLEIHDLGIIEALVPEVQDFKGEIETTLSASGTLAQPKFNGNVSLINGTFRVPRLGLGIDQISLTGQSDGLEKLTFKLDARSGDGNLLIQGQTQLDKNAGWPSTITIKGETFEVSRIPEARVMVSPDLQVKLQKNIIDITGKIHIPFAKLQPKDITTAARVSDDAVIVGGEQPADEKWLVTTKVRLTLGDRVSFYGFGFEGRFGGSLLLEDIPGQLTRATGEINVVEGRYAAYGQRLDVEQGRLLYTGGPISNPGLDLRAVRKINEVTAGLKVRGTLNQPTVELFSVPAMGETDALSYLMLGRPLETASGDEGSMMAKAALALSLSGGDNLARKLGDRFGLDEMRVESNDTGDQASLVMGRYLSPKLYISYGVGLIEAFNTLNVRYQISDKWQLKGESGEHQSADILYTIER
ncbi:MAG TPA: translocation/assembly module TamB domain-containing protein [Gammaproteobacteria bacterium]